MTGNMVKAADVVITMGCGDACPIYPGKRYEDWELEDPAGKDLETVRRIRDDIEARVNLAWAMINAGKSNDAAAQLEEVVRRRPAHAVAWFLFGEATRRLGDDRQAIARYERAASLDPTMTDALFALGASYYRLNEVDRARESFERVLAIDRDHAGAHYHLGKIALQQGNVDAAIGHLEACVRVMPANKGARYQLARAYRLKGDEARAARELAAFRELGGGDANDDSAEERIDRIGRKKSG